MMRDEDDDTATVGTPPSVSHNLNADKEDQQMPLRRADGAYDWTGEEVLFPMTDGRTRIVCRVTREALEDRASADGRGELMADPVEVFLMHRQRIEQIVSAKHDAGDAKRLVETADLNRGK